MSNSPKENLENLGISLPEPVAPVANYVPYTQSGSLYSISGQITRQVQTCAKIVRCTFSSGISTVYDIDVLTQLAEFSNYKLITGRCN